MIVLKRNKEEVKKIVLENLEKVGMVCFIDVKFV